VSRAPAGAARLVLLRHGQSEWNARNLFTGWANPELTQAGEQEAARAGAALAAHGLLPGFAHTSLQRRAIRSADLALAACDSDWIPVRRSWRLNGRHYGALQGQDKAQVTREYGEEQVRRWRRSYAAAPPRLAPGAEDPAAADPRYASLPPEARPNAESLRDVTARLLPYWYDAIVPDLRAGPCVLVVSHGNTLRALIKHLDAVGDDEIAALNIPNGVPLVYDLGADMRPLARGGRYLGRDPRSGTRHSSSVPPPSAGPVRMVPPSSPARSVRLARPLRRPVCRIPTPLSRTSITRSWPASTVTSTLLAFA
jgi:2,3-bisphosphoglycerate-dependent phosphoglycerate mutase